MRKLIDDTLKGPNGKNSRKSWTSFLSFLLAIITGLYIVFSKEVNPYAISVFQGFLILGGSVLGMTVIDKIPFTRKGKTENDDE